MKQTYNPLTKEEYNSIKAGDVIERMLGFIAPCYLEVVKVENNIIEASLWDFDANTGLEIDKDIPTTVSYISKILTEEEKELVKLNGKL